MDFIVPISIDSDLADKNKIAEEIIFLKETYGFERFLLCGPTAGFRATGIPPESYYETLANIYSEIRDMVAPYGVTCDEDASDTFRIMSVRLV